MRRILCALVFVCAAAVASAQDVGTLDPKPLPPLARPGDPHNAAKQVFGRELTPTEAQTRSIGFYSHGCLAGAESLPLDGDTWRVMRVSRNRYWGNPETIAFLERFSKKAAQEGIWPGILVGDISQPRGGPMLTGHASHQIGLDADIWLTPMPANLTREQREKMSAVEMVRPDGLAVDPAHWSERQAGIIRAAAEEPQVTLIFVNPAIKKAMCREAGSDRTWLAKVRPWWGHDEHFHVRLACPPDSPLCKAQPETGSGDGCGPDLAGWLKKTEAPPSPPGSKTVHNTTLAALPVPCRAVVNAP